LWRVLHEVGLTSSVLQPGDYTLLLENGIGLTALAKYSADMDDALPGNALLLPTRAREALMMAAAGGATRARGWRATAIRFQQFGEGGLVHLYCSPLARARR
jgi:hypothetical protein